MKIFLTILSLLILTSQIDWTGVETAARTGIHRGIFPGGVLTVINKTATIYKKAFGTIQPVQGFFSPRMNTDMIFDINRLTQVVGIGALLMRYYDNGKINVTDRVSRHYTDFGNNNKTYITIQNVMLHNSGLEADFPEPLPKDPNQFLKDLAKSKLAYKTETQFTYSQIGYVVLGAMISKISGKTLDQALFAILLEMGLRDTMYNPKSSQYKFAPGGINDAGIAQGKAFNRYASLLKGMGGNSGLFSTSNDVTKFMELMLNNGKPLIGAKVFSEQVVSLFTKKLSYGKYKNSRALGWDTVPTQSPPCGSKFGINSFGISDTSGSYIWADKDKGIAIVFLANGNYPYPKKNVQKWQGEFSDAIMTALGH